VKTSQLISVIIPAYNEAAYIESNLAETIETLRSLGYAFEVIVVDDGSRDATHLAATRIFDRYRHSVRIVRYEQNQGKGNALICGASCAKGELLVFLDADMDLHPRQLPVLFKILQESGADVVIGSKRHPESNVAYPRLRRLYSAGYFAFVRLLFGLPIRDTQTGLKIFKREVVASVFPRVLAKRFAFDIEVLANAHRLGYRIAEAPVTLEFRRTLSRIRLSDVWSVFIDTIAIFYRMRILRYYDTLDISDSSLFHVAAASNPCIIRHDDRMNAAVMVTMSTATEQTEPKLLVLTH